MRLITAWYSGKRNMRGFGLPSCARGVTVPISTKPKPSASNASICSPFLSSPAPSPTGLGNIKPNAGVGSGTGRVLSSDVVPVR